MREKNLAAGRKGERERRQTARGESERAESGASGQKPTDAAAELLFLMSQGLETSGKPRRSINGLFY